MNLYNIPATQFLEAVINPSSHTVIFSFTHYTHYTFIGLTRSQANHLSMCLATLFFTRAQRRSSIISMIKDVD